jgi:hypothetical protein
MKRGVFICTCLSADTMLQNTSPVSTVAAPRLFYERVLGSVLFILFQVLPFHQET